MLASSITGRFTNIEDYYQVDPRVLGTGRHGSVRECVDRLTGHRYAVKSVRKADPEVGGQGTLAREISVLRRIRGVSRAIDLVDVHEDEEYLHLITGLCEGGELFDRISERADRGARDANAPPCFSEAEAARIIRQILVALQELHRRGIVHRDVKPENILLETADEDSPIRLVDFGLAREHGLKGRLEPPMTSVVGTPYYIAPEVLKGRYDKSCDLWSAGIVAYLLLCGYPPFNGADGEEIHEAVLRGRYRFPSAEWRRTSREARDFVRRLLQRDPEKRMDVRRALRHPWMRRHAERDAKANDEGRQDESSGTRGGPSSRVDAMDCRP
jgi:serine/threonine protein kinase